MVRRWLVRPDQVVQTETYGEVPCVSREAMVAAMLDGEAALARFGGHISVSTTRHPTDFPGEMVTTAAAFIWKDRTDAKEQPERPAPVTPAAMADQIEEQVGLSGDEREAVEAAFAAEDLPGVGDLAEVMVAVRDAIGDGLDEATLEDEDLSAVPEHAR